MAGDNVTIADIGAAALASNSNIVVPIESDSYPKLADWFKRIKSFPFYKENEHGLALTEARLNKALQK